MPHNQPEKELFLRMEVIGGLACRREAAPTYRKPEGRAGAAYFQEFVDVVPEPNWCTCYLALLASARLTASTRRHRGCAVSRWRYRAQALKHWSPRALPGIIACDQAEVDE